jgi:hypothetical protein
MNYINYTKKIIRIHKKKINLFYIYFLYKSAAEISDLAELKSLKEKEPFLKKRWLIAQKRLARLEQLQDFISDEDKLRSFFGINELQIDRKAYMFGAHGFGASSVNSFVSRLPKVSNLILIDPDLDGMPEEYVKKDLGIPILAICSNLFGQIGELNSFFVDYIRRFYDLQSKLWNANRTRREENIFLSLRDATHVFPVDWLLFRAREYSLGSWIKSKRRVEDYFRFDAYLIKSYVNDFLPGKMGKGEFYDTFNRTCVIPFRMTDMLDLKNFD